jgi:hypothetical protein
MENEVEVVYQHQDGSPVKMGITVTPDVYEQTFTVTTRSMRHLSSEQIRELLIKKYDARVKEVKMTITVR